MHDTINMKDIISVMMQQAIICVYNQTKL